MSVNWTPLRKLRARGVTLGPLVVGGDTVSVIDLIGEYLVFTLDTGGLTAWAGTFEKAMAIGEEWLMAKLSAHETLAVHAERARLAGHRSEPRLELKDATNIGRAGPHLCLYATVLGLWRASEARLTNSERN